VHIRLCYIICIIEIEYYIRSRVSQLFMCVCISLYNNARNMRHARRLSDAIFTTTHSERLSCVYIHTMSLYALGRVCILYELRIIIIVGAVIYVFFLVGSSPAVYPLRCRPDLRENKFGKRAEIDEFRP